MVKMKLISLMKRILLPICMRLVLLAGFILGMLSLRAGGGEYAFYREPLAAAFFRTLAAGGEESLPASAPEEEGMAPQSFSAEEEAGDIPEPPEAPAADGPVPAEEAAVQETSEGPGAEGTDPPEAVEAVSLELPPDACSEVFPATEYGNTQSKYLSPEGTVYERDKYGIFAPNGEYYSLQPVTEAYFEDALFIGDSRTEGLYRYGTLNMQGDFFARRSMRTDQLFKKKISFFSHDNGEESLTLEEVLNRRQYGKIYICLGINELGSYNAKRYYEEYRAVLVRIRGLQPGALIFIEGMMHVTKADAKKNGYETNTNIVERNQAISTLANGRDIFYLDMNEPVCDEEGNLRSELSNDGVHLKISGYTLWKDFLFSHGILIPEAAEES